MFACTSELAVLHIIATNGERIFIGKMSSVTGIESANRKIYNESLMFGMR